MYKELVKELRHLDEYSKQINPTPSGIFKEAADAIEELSRENESLAKSVNKAAELLHKRGTPPKWIPVTERLPEYGDWVLGIGPKHGYHVCEYRGITHFPYSGNSPWFSGKGRALTITHWMPLPKPPKEET